MIPQREYDIKMLKCKCYMTVISWITKAKKRMACHQKIISWNCNWDYNHHWDYNFLKTQNKVQMTWFKEHKPKISLKHTK